KLPLASAPLNSNWTLLPVLLTGLISTPWVVVTIVALALLTPSCETSCPASPPVKVTVQGPPLLPVTVTLPLTAGIVFRFDWIAPEVVPVPSVIADAFTPLKENVVDPLVFRVIV